MEHVQLSQHLELIAIDQNLTRNNELVSVLLNFKFFDQHGDVYVAIEKISNDYPSYGMIEIGEGLIESFEDQLEEYWNEIVKTIKTYKEQWYKENF